MNLEQARFNMIEQQIRPCDVRDAAILDLFARVGREAFVPEAWRSMAFADLCIPLPGYNEADGVGRCMLEPRTDARLLQLAQVRAHDQVLEIGTGSGYMAALLGGLARQVQTLEIEPELAALAQRQLHAQGVHNVQVREVDASTFTAPEASFDLIVLSGSVPEVPPALLNLLKQGGRLVGIVGTEPIMQATTIVRSDANRFRTTRHWETAAPALLHFPNPDAFRF